MLKVLAIDDVREYSLLISALLRNLFPGIKVLTAQTGEEGIEIAKKELPDTILLDINMPGMDGYQACKILKKYTATKNIPVIMVTGFSSDAKTGRKAIECGADGLLAKPINEGELLGQVNSAFKINEQKKACKEKELLLRDIHHRIKNNLTIVSSLLNMQSALLDDPAAKAAFAESRKRINAISLIHEKLYLGENLSHIDFQAYAHDLLEMVIDSFPIPRDTINLNLDIENLHFTPDVSIPLGLIVTELTTNALKYGRRENQNLDIHVRLFHDNNHVHLFISDTGPGLPEDLDWKNTETLGLQLVSMLTGQLDGTADLDRQNGTSFHISFPFEDKEVDG